MQNNYNDIRSKIKEEPQFFDQNGVPRYCLFSPSSCPNIYSDTVILALIRCQACQELIKVEMHSDLFESRLQKPVDQWYYGDPPFHGGCSGETMTSDTVKILEVWHRDKCKWERRTDLEGMIDVQPEGEEMLGDGQNA